MRRSFFRYLASRGRASRYGTRVYFDGHFAPFGKLDRIAEKILQKLTQPLTITRDPRRHFSADGNSQLQSLFFGSAKKRGSCPTIKAKVRGYLYLILPASSAAMSRILSMIAISDFAHEPTVFTYSSCPSFRPSLVRRSVIPKMT